MLEEIGLAKRPPQNTVTQLIHRQSTIMSPSQWYYHHHNFYNAIVPNYTENQVLIRDKCYPRKFSPDGKWLLAFSLDQHNVEVYRFNGSCAANELYDSKKLYQQEMQSKLFNVFFTHTCSIMVSQTIEVLNRECSLFTPDCGYVIVGSSVSIMDDPPAMNDTFKNNESLSPNPRFLLEDYTLYIVNLSCGCVSDSQTFKCDKIMLSHNQGLSLCGHKLAVLSAQHQTIHLYEIVSGQFVPLQEIGRFCYSDDNLVFNEANISNCISDGDINSREYVPFLEKWLNSLKHRFLCCILRNAQFYCTSDDTQPLQHFYRRFDYYNSLRIWKIQFIDQEMLLLKYTTEDIITMKQTDVISQPAFFAFYNMTTTEIVAVYENTSLAFLKLYESHADDFRTVVSHPLAYNVSSVSNCPYGRALHMKFKQTITNAKYGGINEATKRLLVQLPMCSQLFSCSPYLDLSLFKYDDKWISQLERPKPCGDAPVKYVIM